jgi:hypothetical protein
MSPPPATASAEGAQFNVPPSRGERGRVRGFLPILSQSMCTDMQLKRSTTRSHQA